jgi:hypothetical protein
METKKAEKRNGKIKLYPLKFEDAVKEIVQAKSPYDKGVKNNG